MSAPRSAAIAALGVALATAAGAQDMNNLSATLYAPDDEIDGQRIGWWTDDVLGAYERAVATGKPLVFVLSDSGCVHCAELVRRALVCPRLNALAGQAVFAISDNARDEVAERLRTRLEIDTVPTVSVIAPESERIREIVRLKGVFADAEFARELAAVDGIDPVDPAFFLPPLSRGGVVAQCGD